MKRILKWQFIKASARVSLFSLICFALILAVGSANAVVNPNHPRIWLTPELLDVVQQRIDDNTLAWQRFRDIALNPNHYYYSGAYANSLMYQLTGDTQYAESAYASIEGYLSYEVVDPNSFSSGGGAGAGYITTYNTRTILPSVAIVFDWCYDWLDETQKATIIDKLNEWMDFINDPRTWGKSPSSDYFYGHLIGQGLASIATYGDNPRAQEFMDDTRNRRFEELCVPYLNSIGEGGGWPEGGYSAGAMERIFMYMEAVRTATGENLLSMTNFPSECAYYMIHQTEPNRSSLLPFDRWSGGAGTIWDRHRAYMAILGYMFPGDDVGRYAYGWRNHMERQPGGSWLTTELLSELLWYDPTAPTGDVTELPLSYFAPGVGQVMARSDWTEDATHISFRNARYVATEQHHDAGHFMISKGDRLAVDRWMYADIYDHLSVSHNVLQITGPGQYQQDQSPGIGSAPDSTDYEEGGDYVWMKGDLTRAYGEETEASWITRDRLVDSYTRQIVFLRPDYFVVLDRVTTPEPDYSKRWLLHTPPNEPQVDGDLVTVIGSTGEGKLFSKTLKPDAFSINKVAEGSAWRIEVQPTIAQRDDIFLHVLQATDVSTPSMSPTKRIDGTTMVGAQIADIDIVAMFGREETELEGGQFHITGSGIYRTIIADLIPDESYNVYVDGGLLPLSPFSAMDNGLLVFDLERADGAPLDDEDHLVTISLGSLDDIEPAAITDLVASPGVPGSVD